jgi:hypothetical protein
MSVPKTEPAAQIAFAIVDELLSLLVERRILPLNERATVLHRALDRLQGTGKGKGATKFIADEMLGKK